MGAHGDSYFGKANVSWCDGRLGTGAQYEIWFDHHQYSKKDRKLCWPVAIVIAIVVNLLLVRISSVRRTNTWEMGDWRLVIVLVWYVVSRSRW